MGIYYDALEEFIKQHRDEYKDKGLKSDDIRDICVSVFLAIKRIMGSGCLEEVRIMHFGLFKIYKKSIFRMRYIKTRDYKNGKISKEEYDQMCRDIE